MSIYSIRSGVAYVYYICGNDEVWVHIVLCTHSFIHTTGQVEIIRTSLAESQVELKALKSKL